MFVLLFLATEISRLRFGSRTSEQMERTPTRFRGPSGIPSSRERGLPSSWCRPKEEWAESNRLLLASSQKADQVFSRFLNRGHRLLRCFRCRKVYQPQESFGWSWRRLFFRSWNSIYEWCAKLSLSLPCRYQTLIAPLFEDFKRADEPVKQETPGEGSIRSEGETSKAVTFHLLSVTILPSISTVWHSLDPLFSVC